MPKEVFERYTGGRLKYMDVLTGKVDGSECPDLLEFWREGEGAELATQLIAHLDQVSTNHVDQLKIHASCVYDHDGISLQLTGNAEVQICG